MHAYSAAFPRSQVHLCAMGIANTDNAMIDFFPPKKPFINMIDDVRAVEKLFGDGVRKHNKLIKTLKKLYAEMVSRGASYGGFYPVPNAYWMSRSETTTLCCIMEPVSIVINDPTIRITTNHKADFQKVIEHFQRNGCVVRYNWIALKVDYYKGSGGIVGRTARSEKSAALQPKKKYPGHIAGVVTKANGTTSLKLRRLNQPVRAPRTAKATQVASESRKTVHYNARPWCPAPGCRSRGRAIKKQEGNRWKCKVCGRKFRVCDKRKKE